MGRLAALKIDRPAGATAGRDLHDAADSDGGELLAQRRECDLWRSGGSSHGFAGEVTDDSDCIRTVVSRCSLPLVCRCRPSAGGEAEPKYSGTWKRDLYGEGEVQMKLASNGGVELMLPSPRWPDSVDMKGQAAVRRAIRWSSRPIPPASACQTADARYVVSRTEDQLHIAGLGHGQLRRPPGGAGGDLAEVVAARSAARSGAAGQRGRKSNERVIRFYGPASPPPRFPAARRPLLGDAVEGAQSPDQIGAVDADDVPAGKQRL